MGVGEVIYLALPSAVGAIPGLILCSGGAMWVYICPHESGNTLCTILYGMPRTKVMIVQKYHIDLSSHQVYWSGGGGEVREEGNIWRLVGGGRPCRRLALTVVEQPVWSRCIVS